MDDNFNQLRAISTLVPDQGIREKTFHVLYPNWPNDPGKQGQLDDLVAQLLTWYLASVQQWKGRDELLNKLLEEKDKRLGDKEATEKQLSALLINAEKRPSDTHKWGTVTRSQVWNKLMKDGHTSQLKGMLPEQEHRQKEKLLDDLGSIDWKKWKDEKEMYEPIMQAMRMALYRKNSRVCVADTHNKGDFRPDICVADYQDDRLYHTLWYFIELKVPGISLTAPETCGQVVDYFNKAHENQLHRSDFVAILSNFTTTSIFTAKFEANTIKISSQFTPTLADAIIYADAQSRIQFTKHVPSLDRRFAKFTILAVTNHHFLLKVPLPTIENEPWRSPSRHHTTGFFVLKVVHGDTTVTNEVRILRKIRDAECGHLPQLVWAPGRDKQLGIVPTCQPIDFQQTAFISRNIVHGLMDGLQYLHEQGIVHRDIRPSNLVLDPMGNVVIIDYETAVLTADNVSVEYLGGFICWPKELLKSSTDSALYTPKPADDLLACILVVLHLLFPSRFDRFRANAINPGPDHNEETVQLLKLWEEIEQSKIWGIFVKAAETQDYEQLKDMADVFCHI